MFWKVCNADTPCIFPVTNRWTPDVFRIVWSEWQNFRSVECMTCILIYVCMYMYLCMPAMCLIDITRSGWHLYIRWRLGQYSFILLGKTMQLLSNSQPTIIIWDRWLCRHRWLKNCKNLTSWKLIDFFELIVLDQHQVFHVQGDSGGKISV